MLPDEPPDDPPVPAPLPPRVAAAALDFAVISVVFFLFIYTAFGGNDEEEGEVLGATFWFLLYHAYYFLPELFWNGRTLGKWVVGLRVVDENGGRPDPFRILVRTLLRLIDFLPALYLGGFLVCWMTGPERRARLGDLAGGTYVIRDLEGSLRAGRAGS